MSSSSRATTQLMFSCISPWLNDIKNDVDAAKDAIERGADINVQIEQTYATPLILAVHNNRYELVKYLVTVPGVQQHIRLKCGETAFMWACTGGKLEIAKLLLQSEIDPQSSIQDALEIIKSMHFQGWDEIMSWLLKSEEDIFFEYMNNLSIDDIWLSE